MNMVFVMIFFKIFLLFPLKLYVHLIRLYVFNLHLHLKVVDFCMQVMLFSHQLIRLTLIHNNYFLDK